MNVIDTLVRLREISEAYGARMNFRHVSQPIVINLPEAASSYEAARLLQDEVYARLGIMSERDGMSVILPSFSL